MPIVPNIIAYHCNEDLKCQKFVSENCLIQCVEDGIWLGSGMYFWDTLSNAYFWKRKKQRDDNSKKYSIVNANIILLNMLDLTDIDTCNYVGYIWQKYCDSIKRNYSASLGKKLNLLFNEFPDFKKLYYVIKVFGKYNNTFPNDLFTYNIKSCNAEPTLAVKCIYSVRNAKCLSSKGFCN